MRRLPAYHYPNGMAIPEEKLTRPDSIVDSAYGYMLVCHATASPHQFLYEIWSEVSGCLARYVDFAPAWGRYLRVVRIARNKQQKENTDA